MGKMLEEMHQNIMVILECLRGRIMGNSIFSYAFFWIFQVFYNLNVLFYNKEINLKKKTLVFAWKEARTHKTDEIVL